MARGRPWHFRLTYPLGLKLMAIYWAMYRAERRFGKRLIEWLIARYRWHNSILDTDTPNVGCLRVKSLVVINGYGQEHVVR